jgi:hypothetical protein
MERLGELPVVDLLQKVADMGADDFRIAVHGIGALHGRAISIDGTGS